MSLTPRLDRIDKNYFINGAMEYYQVSTSAAIPASYDYVGPDMFENQYSGSWTSPNVARSITKVGSRSRRSMLLTGTAGLVTDELHLKTKIESILAMELIDDVFSLGLKLKSDNFTQVRIILSYADTEDVFSSVTQIAEQTITFSSDSSEQEIKFENISPNPNMSNGLQIEFEFKGLDSAAAVNLYVGEFILNKGAIKNDYAPCGRDQIEELALCQRYSYNPTIGGNAFFATSIRSANAYFNLPFPVNMRINPSIASGLFQYSIDGAAYVVFTPNITASTRTSITLNTPGGVANDNDVLMNINNVILDARL